MKNLTLASTAVFLLIMAASTVTAQNNVGLTDPVHKGAWKVGGNIGFDMKSGDAYENDGDGITVITLSPQAMYFVMDKLGIGARLHYTSTSQGDVTNSNLAIGPELSYYFALQNSKFYPFLGAGVFFGSRTNTVTDPITNTEIESTSSSTVILLHGGVMYAINQYVGVNGSLNYEMHSFENTDGSVFGVRFGFDIFLH